MERPTDAEFEELKHKRDEAIRAVVKAACEKHGWDPAKTSFHSSDMHGCYCACPTGPCEHIWDGPEQVITDDHDEPCGSSKTCSKCGTDAMSHDMRCCEF